MTWVLPQVGMDNTDEIERARQLSTSEHLTICSLIGKHGGVKAVESEVLSKGQATLGIKKSVFSKQRDMMIISRHPATEKFHIIRAGFYKWPSLPGAGYKRAEEVYDTFDELMYNMTGG